MRVNLADARITGNGKVGGIAGYAFKTTLEDCTVAANVCIHYVNSQSDYHGGIVGFCSNGTVQRCISHVTFTAINDCEFYGAIAGEVCGSNMPANNLRGLDEATALETVKTTSNATDIYVMGTNQRFRIP